MAKRVPEGTCLATFGSLELTDVSRVPTSTPRGGAG